MILYVKCGFGVGMFVGTDLFEYLKRLDPDVVMRILNVTNDNELDATSTTMRLFQLVNAFVGYEQLRKCNHVQCVSQSVKLAMLQVLKLICQPIMQLLNDLMGWRISKVIQQHYQIDASCFDLSSTDSTHADLPTRSTRLAMGLFKIQSGKQLPACQDFFPHHWRSWKAPRRTTSSCLTLCYCPSPCLSSIEMKTSSTCKRYMLH